MTVACFGVENMHCEQKREYFMQRNQSKRMPEASVTKLHRDMGQDKHWNQMAQDLKCLSRILDLN